jgi:hypothetical protein
VATFTKQRLRIEFACQRIIQESVFTNREKLPVPFLLRQPKDHLDARIRRRRKNRSDAEMSRKRDRCSAAAESMVSGSNQSRLGKAHIIE